MSQSRKHRGYKTQAIAAEWFQQNGWPFAQSTGAGRQGSDLTGMLGLAVEIKARADFNPLAWIKQAEKNTAPLDLPFVIWRPNGYGEANIASWPVMLRLGPFTDLLHEAGH